MMDISFTCKEVEQHLTMGSIWQYLMRNIERDNYKENPVADLARAKYQYVI